MLSVMVDALFSSAGSPTAFALLYSRHLFQGAANAL